MYGGNAHTETSEEFKLLFITHRWAPVDISASNTTLMYDTAVKLSFDLTGDAFYGKLSLDQTGAPELLVRK